MGAPPIVPVLLRDFPRRIFIHKTLLPPIKRRLLVHTAITPSGFYRPNIVLLARRFCIVGMQIDQSIWCGAASCIQMAGKARRPTPTNVCITGGPNCSGIHIVKCPAKYPGFSRDVLSGDSPAFMSLYRTGIFADMIPSCTPVAQSGFYASPNNTFNPHENKPWMLSLICMFKTRFFYTTFIVAENCCGILCAHEFFWRALAKDRSNNNTGWMSFVPDETEGRLRGHFSSEYAQLTNL